jgi:SAM-dependent methyltransferase
MSSAPSIFQHDYYQRLYDIEANHWWARGMRRAMDALLHRPLQGRSNLRVLDLGCGTGLLLQYLQRYGVAGEVIGLDYSDHALRFCRQRGAQALLLGDAVQPPLADASFDLIIFLDTLQHLSPAGADQTALQACTRLLRPGGWLYLRTNSVLGHRPLQGVDPNQYRRYDRRRLRIMVREAGLQVHRATYLNCLPGLWAALGEYRRLPATDTPAIGPGLAIQVPRSRLKNRLMQGVLAVEATWVRYADLPFGHSLAIVAQKPEL